MRTILGLIRLISYLFWCVVMIPPQILMLMIDKKHKAYILPHIFHKVSCRLFGLRYRIEGTPSTDHQTLFVGNHISYLDIPVIGSVVKGSFVAKKEVAGWPLFGLLAKLQQTAFIDRTRHGATDSHNTVQKMLTEGRSVILFPEGTSSDGTRVLPFKSALFQGFLKNDMRIQPLTISLVEADGKPAITQDLRDLYAWYGEIDLLPHLWAFSKTKGAEVVLTFHPVHRASEFHDRKTLAETCHNDVQAGLKNNIDHPLDFKAKAA